VQNEHTVQVVYEFSTDTVKAGDRMRSEFLVLRSHPSRENIIPWHIGIV
jgi:hypothetical protein